VLGFHLYHSIKKIALLFSFTLFFGPINAQHKDPVDSTRIFNEDPRGTADSLEEATVGDTQNDEGNMDTPVVKKSIYFSDKEVSGGPDSLQIRKLPDSIVKKWQTGDDSWYVNYLFRKEKKKEEEKNLSFAASMMFQTILWLVIIAGFAAFVVIYLANSNVSLFRKAGKSLSSAEEGDIETDNIFEINYQREIEKAASNGNYRFAVRLMFLRALKNLSDKKVIQYKQDRTNFDYLMQLYSTRYYTDFFRLTRNYEYSWYGQFAIEPEKYTIIKNDFENFDHNLNYR